MVFATKLMLKTQFEQNKAGWKKSFLDGFSQDENSNPVPWMTYPAIEFLKNNLTKDHEIFEYGCGASTLFFSTIVKSVTGIETNKRWMVIVEEKLLNSVAKKWTPSFDGVTNYSSSTTSQLVIPSNDGVHLKNSERTISISLMEDGLTNNAYENFAKNSGKKFDLVIVDSLKRFECAKNAIDAIKPDGAVILDDSERSNYKKIFDFFAERGFKKQDFFGIAPGQLRIKNTTIFSRI